MDGRLLQTVDAARRVAAHVGHGGHDDRDVVVGHLSAGDGAHRGGVPGDAHLGVDLQGAVGPPALDGLLVRADGSAEHGEDLRMRPLQCIQLGNAGEPFRPVGRVEVDDELPAVDRSGTRLVVELTARPANGPSAQLGLVVGVLDGGGVQAPPGSLHQCVHRHPLADGLVQRPRQHGRCRHLGSRARGGDERDERDEAYRATTVPHSPRPLVS